MNFRILIAAAVLSLLIFYTGLCINRVIPGQETTDWIISLAIVFTIIGSQIFDRTLAKRAPKALSRIIAWLGSLLMGLWATFILLCVMLDCGYLILLLGMTLIRPSAPWDAAVVQQWMHTLFILAGVLSVIFTLLGLFQALRGPKVRKVRIPINGLPQGLEGLRIAQLSDLHIGATIRRDYIAGIVRKTMALAPDIIALTGDLADGTPDVLQPHSAPLGELDAPLGKYYITGNHEYYSDALAWIEECTKLGFIPLLNENRILLHKQAKIMVAGVTDISGHHFIPSHQCDPAKAALTSEQCDFKLLLAHQPEACFAAQPEGFNLQLSGHTHGGQFFPFNILVKLAKRYYRGLNRYRDMWLYVNPGTGYWGAANRFGVPAEITMLVLSAA